MAGGISTAQLIFIIFPVVISKNLNNELAIQGSLSI